MTDNEILARCGVNVDEEAYKTKVEALIRERYSLSDELAISRQRDTKPAEFEEYFNYCEECKRRARESV